MKKESYLEECEEGNYIVFLPNSETQIVRVNDRDETRVINILLENESILKRIIKMDSFYMEFLFTRQVVYLMIIFLYFLS